MKNEIRSFFLATLFLTSNCALADDALRQELAWELHDIKHINKLVREVSYLTQQTELDEESRLGFEEWLVKKSIFLGSPHYDHDRLFKKVPNLAKNKKFVAAYPNFIKNISPRNRWKSGVFPRTQKNISVLYTGSYGGGHKNPALAIAKHFETMGHKIQLIDVDEISDRYSPRIDGYTRGQLYQEVFQKEGDIEKEHSLRERIDNAQTIESKKYLGDIKKMIRNFRADHIFAVAHHKRILGYLSYQLAIPMTFVHTDFAFKKKLVPLVKEQRKLKEPLIKFATLSTKRSFVENLYEAFKVKKDHLPKSITKQIVFLGFPTRPSFTPVTEKRKKKLRDELGIPHKAIVCKLAMGVTGVPKEIKDIMNQIIAEQKELSQPLHLYVICGKNVELKAELEGTPLRTRTGSGKIAVHIMGFLDEQTMAKIDQASDVWITKPGGSTCAELVATQKQMLYVFNLLHVWEKSNADYLCEIGLADEYSPDKSIIKQLDKRIRKQKHLKASDYPDSDWQSRVNRILDDGIA